MGTRADLADVMQEGPDQKRHGVFDGPNCFRSERLLGRPEQPRRLPHRLDEMHVHGIAVVWIALRPALHPGPRRPDGPDRSDRFGGQRMPEGLRLGEGGEKQLLHRARVEGPDLRPLQD